NNPNSVEIDSAKIINMIGQVVMTFDTIETSTSIELKTKNLSVGAYIIKLETEIGEVSKKVLVK
ncbi:T9SS type A sorting domain-containing protein, partial [Lacinutrix iliipiscaria]